MKATVLFMCSALPTGGAERQWATLIPGLARRGFDVRLVTLAGRGRFFDEIAASGIPSDCAEMRSRFDVAGIARAFALAKPQPDLVVTHEPNASAVGHTIARRARAPHIVVTHRAAGRAVKPHRRIVERVLAPRVDGVIAVSRSQIEELESRGYNAADITVIPNGVAPLVPTQTREAVRDSLGLNRGDFVALLVAALRPVKRAEVFVQAVARAHTADRRIVGLVAGGGESLGALRVLAADCESPVQLLGERADVADLMTASDVACLTSAIETSPIALMEAMSLARPVVAPARGGTSEVVSDGETGILVSAMGSTDADVAEYARILQALAADELMTQTMGRAGLQRYERLFTVDRMLDGYEGAVSGLVARQR